MEPLLRAGTVVELAPFQPKKARIGDIVVFPDRGSLTAHRVIAIGKSEVRTSGDNRPTTVERVPFDEIAGTVAAVYESDAPESRRIDDAVFTRRGRVYARLHAIRAALRRAGFLSSRVVRAFSSAPRGRFAALHDALRGWLRNDPESIACALGGVDAEALAAVAERHACAPLLQQAARAIRTAEALALMERLQPYVRDRMLRAPLMGAQVASIVAALNAGQISFALLKGTARVYAGEAESELFPSHDIDVLVPREALAAAIEALLARGYAFRATAREHEEYRRHHHIAPLYPPGGQGWFVELHTQLTIPGWLSTPTDWEALASHFVRIEGPGGPALVLDRFGSTLHHAVHGLALERFRDAILCARGLLALDARERAALQALAAAERHERVRLSAVLALSADLAGIEWPAPGEDVAAYLRWVAAREDFPLALRNRAQVAEAWFAAGQRPTAIRPGVFTYETSPLRVAGRIAIAPLALAGAAMSGR
ncbi:MAG: nucleotidyltransferase family protein [Candidatus Eremiobacteraeota bacterium]|nr:nucleotidyltransferase family protein [Candidatus Eremiobacteraeota bacterium]